MEGYLAEIRMFAGNFEPLNWAFCAGQTIAISQNQALFSLLGTTYGGNGTSTFGLPDLRGRIPVGTGTGPGLTPVSLGAVAGTQTNTISIQNLPAHNHTATATVTPAANSGGRGVVTSASPVNNFPAPASSEIYATTTNALMGQSPVNITIGATGNNIPVNNLQPYLGMNYIICLYGIFPSRN